MDQPKLDRLLRLMKLLTGNKTHTVQELADRFETTTRTIYRYIDTFREAGFIIKKNDNMFRIDRSSPYFKDISQLVHFTEEEAYILKSAIENIDENNLIKQNLKRKLYTVYDYRILAETVVKGRNAQNVNRLVEAIEQRKQVVLNDYSSASSKEMSSRRVEPFAFTTNYIQIWAYEPASAMNKLFKLSRIASVTVLPDDWAFPENHQKGFIDCFRISSDNQFTVKLKLSMRAAQLLIEEYPLAEKHLVKITDNNWEFETQVCNYQGVGRFVMGLLSEIEIVESTDFQMFIKQKIDEASNKYR